MFGGFKRCLRWLWCLKCLVALLVLKQLGVFWGVKWFEVGVVL